MPRSREQKEKVTQVIENRYADGAVTYIEDAYGKPLREFIDEEIPEELLTDPNTIEIYKTRLRDSRRGIFPGRSCRTEKMTLKEVGQQLGISAVMVAAKEGGNAQKPLREIDRNDLLMFCCLYQVSPHYLLGLVDSPTQYCRSEKRQSLTEKEDSNRKAEAEEEKCLTEKNIDEVPILFLPEEIELRGKFVLYELQKEEHLLEYLIRLAEVPQDVQQHILSRFEYSGEISSCPIEEKLKWVSGDEFRAEWLEYVVFDKNGDLLSKRMTILAQLGFRNFTVLDFIARIAACDNKTRKMVQLVLEDDVLFQKELPLGKMTNP